MNLIIDIFQNHFKAVLPELYFITAIIIILVYGVMYNPSVVYRFPILTKVIGWLAAQTLTLTLLLTWNGWNTVGSAVTNILIFHNVLILDDFTLIVKCIILLSALSSIFISFDYIKGQKINSFEYIILILFPTFSMLFIVSSYDLISLYLAIELQSLSFYVIAAFQRNNEFSAESGLKYSILGALSSGLLLFGESIVYGLTGITNFEELTKLFTFFSFNEGHVINAISMGLLFMLVAFLSKIGAVPFHMWAPDVYEGAPTSVTAFFAITPKVAILSLILRLCYYTFYDLIEFWQQLIIVSAFLSMLIGTLGAINQKKIKRLFAYSSIAHVGYLLIGLATGTIEAVESLSIYITVYVLMIINVFGIILSMSKENYHSFDLMTRGVFGVWVPKGGSEIGVPLSSIEQESHDKVFAAFSFQNKFRGFINSTLPTDSANLAYFIGPNSSFIYMLRTKFQLENTMQNLISLEQKKLADWEKKYLKAGQPLWDPYSLRAEFINGGGSQILPLSMTSLVPLVGEHSSFNNSVNNVQRPSLSSIKIKKKDEFVKSITDFSSLAKANPTLAVTFAIVLFSNAGIPPLAGFYGKLNVFLAALEGSMYFLAISGILCSAMGAFYSTRSIKIIYSHKINQHTWHKYKSISKESAFMLGLTFFFTLFFFFYPSFLFIITHFAALSLCL